MNLKILTFICLLASGSVLAEATKYFGFHQGMRWITPEGNFACLDGMDFQIKYFNRGKMPRACVTKFPPAVKLIVDSSSTHCALFKNNEILCTHDNRDTSDKAGYEQKKQRLHTTYTPYYGDKLVKSFGGEKIVKMSSGHRVACAMSESKQIKCIPADDFIYEWKAKKVRPIFEVQFRRGKEKIKNYYQAIGMFSNSGICIESDWGNIYCKRLLGQKKVVMKKHGRSFSRKKFDSSPIVVKQEDRIPTNGAVKQFVVNGKVGCFINQSDDLYCFYDKVRGRIKEKFYEPPVKMNLGDKVRQVDIGGGSYGAVCALLNNGTVSCWEHIKRMEKGNTFVTNLDMPKGATEIVTGGMVACGIYKNTDPYCTIFNVDMKNTTWTGRVKIPKRKKAY